VHERDVNNVAGTSDKEWWWSASFMALIQVFTIGQLLLLLTKVVVVVDNHYWKVHYSCEPENRQGNWKNHQKNQFCQEPDRHIPSRIG